MQIGLVILIIIVKSEANPALSHAKPWVSGQAGLVLSHDFSLFVFFFSKESTLLI